MKLHVIGDELSGENALKLARGLAHQQFGSVDRVVLSLRQATTVDASGIAVLVRLYSQLSRAGIPLIVTDVPAHVQQMLQETGLSTVLSPRHNAA